MNKEKKGWWGNSTMQGQGSGWYHLKPLINISLTKSGTARPFVSDDVMWYYKKYTALLNEVLLFKTELEFS